ncbi:MAG: hypothetical protein ACI4XJ_08315 [Eubacteriales bacterium]
MRYYRRRSGGEKMSKLVFRVFFVICAALVITILSALLGNYLKNKIAAADEAMSESKEAAGIQLSREENTETYADGKSTFTMRGAGILLTDYAGRDELVLAVNTLAEHYDTLLVPINAEDGTMLYSSPALKSLTRQPDVQNYGNDGYEKADESAYSLLSSASSAAKAKNMNICAVMAPSQHIDSPKSAAFIDSLVISELYENGISRVMVKFAAPNEDDENYSRWIQSYVSTLDAENSELGFAFCSDYIINASGVKQVQSLAESGAFLGVYFDALTGSYEQIYAQITHSLNSMLGMFSVYNLNVLIDADENTAAMYNACTDAGITSVSFLGYVMPDKLSSDASDYGSEPDRQAEPETEHNPEDFTNPYASTADNYSDKSESSDETESIESEDENSDSADNGNTQWY